MRMQINVDILFSFKAYVFFFNVTFLIFDERVKQSSFTDKLFSHLTDNNCVIHLRALALEKKNAEYE